MGPVVSGGGVLVVLDELDELDDVVLVELEDEVDDFEVLDELVVGEVLVGAVGTAVPVEVAVGTPVAVAAGVVAAVGTIAARVSAVLQVSSGSFVGSPELTRLAAEIHAGAVSWSGWRMTNHEVPERPMTQTRSPRCRVATAGPRLVSSLQP